MRWHALIAIWLGQVFDGMDASIFVITLFPALSELLHTSSYSVVGVHGSIIMAIFMMGWAIGAVVSGILADYIGRTRMLTLTILLYALATGLCATSHNWVELAFYRFLVGCGIGGEISAGGVMLAECWRGKARMYTSGLMPAGFCVGYLLTALLNLVLGHLSWRWLFVVGVIPALLTVYIRAKLKDPISFQLTQEYKKHLRTKQQSDLTHQEIQLLRFTFGRLFSNEYLRNTLVVMALASITIIGYWAALSWVPAWINQLMGTSAVQERSTAAIVMNMGSIVASAMAGLIVTWLGRRNAFRFAFLGSLLSCGGMFLTVKTFGLSLLLWVFAAGAFCVLPFALLFIYTPELFKTEIRGTAFGFSFQIGRAAAAVAALISGQLIALFGGSYALAGACIASLYIIGILASFFMPNTTGEIAEISQINSGNQTQI